MATPTTAAAKDPDTASQEEEINLSVLGDFVGFRLRILQLQFYEHFYQMAAFEGLGPSAVTLIFAIGANPGVRHGQLARALKIRRSNLSKMIGGMETDGIVTRRDSSSDKRTFRLYLTDKGKALSERLATAMSEHEHAATLGLSDPERMILLGLLGKLSEHLSAALASSDEAGDEDS